MFVLQYFSPWAVMQRALLVNSPSRFKERSMMDAPLLAGMTATAGVLQLIIMMWTNPLGSALKLVGGVAYCLFCCSHTRVCSSKHILPLQTAWKMRVLLKGYVLSQVHTVHFTGCVWCRLPCCVLVCRNAPAGVFLALLMVCWGAVKVF